MARQHANRAALAYVEALAENPGNHAGRISRLRDEYQERLAQLEYAEELTTQPDPERLPASHFNRLVHAALQVERTKLIELRNQHQINDETLRLIQRDIDLAEVRLEAEH